MKRGGPLKRYTRLGCTTKPKPKAKGTRRKLEDMTHPELEEKLDYEVSFFVRASRAAYSEHHGYLQCVTCGNWKHWKELDCGHYIPRHRRGTRYDLRNLRPQCVECNKWREGEHWKFRQVLVEELGEQEVQSLELLASMWGDDRHPREWMLMKIEEFRERNKPIRKAIRELGQEGS